MMNWKALSPGMGCSEECEHLNVCLDGERMQFCPFRRCYARFWSPEELWLSFDRCDSPEIRGRDRQSVLPLLT